MGTALVVRNARLPRRREENLRAAQYVRMSTDRQQYSIPNQMAAIALYAAEHIRRPRDTESFERH